MHTLFTYESLQVRTDADDGGGRTAIGGHTVTFRQQPPSLFITSIVQALQAL